MHIYHLHESTTASRTFITNFPVPRYRLQALQNFIDKWRITPVSCNVIMNSNCPELHVPQKGYTYEDYCCSLDLHKPIKGRGLLLNRFPKSIWTYGRVSVIRHYR